ncbi:MAG: prolyl oligopeptidase family serine peptidase [Deltaproteobacteria bacterium]|nr:prolyl oligopeptidase family serine peptidase [Deltaproteobacteria bacterium]
MLLVALAAAFLVVSAPRPPIDVATPPADGWQPAEAVAGEVAGAHAETRVLVYLPRGYTQRDEGARFPLVIALHGWGHSPELYRDEGDLGRWADRYGLVVAVPAMGKTVYEAALYPESRKTWAKAPGAPFVAEVVLPWLRRSYAVAQDRAHTAVIGYSTGGRGALVLAERWPGDFAFAGSLSGTFDLDRLAPKTGEYRIHAAVFGPRDEHAARWADEDVDTPAHLAALADVAIYAAHGAADRSVPPDQLDALRAALDGRPHGAVTFALVPGAGHAWGFWTGQNEGLFGALARALGVGDGAR